MTASFAHKGRLTMVEDTGTPSDWSGGKTLEFQNCTLAKHGRHIHPDGIRGSRSASITRNRQGTYSVFGSITVNPTPNELDLFLKLMMGAGSNPNYTLADDVPYFAVMLDTEEDIFLFTRCKIDRAVLRASAARLNEQSNPDLLSLEMRIIGSTFASGQTWPGTAPTIASGNVSSEPFILSDGVFTVETAAREVSSFAFVIDNGLKARFVNSTTATDVCPRRTRFIGARLRHPWDSSHSNLLEMDESETGNQATFVFTNGAVSTTLTMEELTAPNRTSPLIANKGEIFLDREYRAYADAAGNAELTATNDSTA